MTGSGRCDVRKLAFAAALTLALGALAAEPPRQKSSAKPVPKTGPDFVRTHCVACHNASTKEGKLDLTALLAQL